MGFHSAKAVMNLPFRNCASFRSFITPHVHLQKLLAFFLLFSSTLLPADKEKKGKENSPAKNAGVASTYYYSAIDINNLTAWIRADGRGGGSRMGDGVYFPRWTSNVLYLDGYVWGGKAYLNTARTQPAPLGTIRVGGGTYSGTVNTAGTSHQGTAAGWVTGLGSTAVPISPDDPAVRVYRVRRDYYTAADSALREDAAVTSQSQNYSVSSPEYVSETMIKGLRAQYALDWNQWPVAQGAPYIERNGVPGYQAPPPFSTTFTPESLITRKYDEPGIAADPRFPADQVMWTAYNDLNPTLSLSFMGSNPLGLEAQVTIWAYKRTDLLGNVIYRRLRLINKGGVDIGGGTKGSLYIDSMYVGQWADPDIGDGFDDLVGCDSTLSLAFAFNSSPDDAQFQRYNVAPPAIGYSFLQGPAVVSAGDTALIDFKRRGGFKNIGMSSFAYYASGSTISDPPDADYASGTGRWYKMLRGFAPMGTINDSDIPYAVPPGFRPTRFPLSGNPVNGTGFLDGLGTSYSLAPGDRRILLNTGPFSLAPGDTQEVVTMFLAGLGGDRLSSVASLLQTAQLGRAMYDAKFTFPVMPVFSADVSYPNSAEAKVSITGTDRQRDFSSMSCSLKQSDGTTVAEIPLFDDGTHGDGKANDGVFAGSVIVSRRAEAMYVSAMTNPKNGTPLPLAYVSGNITTAGPLQLLNPTILFDNIGGDGAASPDEYIRYRVTIKNTTAFGLNGVSVRAREAYQSATLSVLFLPPGSSAIPPYNLSDPTTYLDLHIPVGFSEPTYPIAFVMSDAFLNRWVDTVRIPIVRLQSSQSYWRQTRNLTGGPITALCEDSTGSLFALITSLGIFRSNDRGDSWISVTPEEYSYRSYSYATWILGAPDGSLLAGGGDCLFRTSDKGQTWNRILVYGYAAGVSPNGKLYLTRSDGLVWSTNGGTTWSAPDTNSFLQYARSIAFNALGHVFVGAQNGTIQRSTDGSTWSQLPFPGYYIRVFYIHKDGSLFLAADTTLYRSTDNGNSWTTTYPGFSTTTMYFDLNGDIYAGSPASGFFVSTDNGMKWRSAGDPVNKGNVLLRDKSGRLYAYNSGLVYRSTNDGASWEEKTAGIRCVSFNAFFSCPNGTILASTTRGLMRSFDQGENWNTTNTLFTNPPTVFAQSTDGSLYSVTPKGVQKSTDSGLSWESPLYSSTKVTSVAVSGTGILFVGQSDSIRIFRSSDAGKTWEKRIIDPGLGYGRITSLMTEPPNYLHAVTSSGVFTSADNGSTWSTVRYKPTGQVLSLAVAWNGKLWALASYFPLYWSTDHGKTWTQTTRGAGGLTNGSLSAFALDASNNIFVGTRYGSMSDSYGSGVFRSTDDGVTWTNLSFGIGADAYPTIRALAVSPSGYLLVGTMDQGMYRSSTITAVKDSCSQIIPASFSLEQNYPNPFNPTTQIRFALPVGTGVKITIYDVLGQRVATLLEETLKAGIHEARWDGRNQFGAPAASGVYFYRMEAGSHVQTNKMVLVK